MTRDQFLREKVNSNWLNIDFSTWEGFGKLWEWVIKQKWWDDFRYWYTIEKKEWVESKLINRWEYIIHPDRFADAIAHYLGWGVTND